MDIANQSQLYTILLVQITPTMEIAEADRIDGGVGMDGLELNDDMSETTERPRPSTSTSTTKPENKQPKRSLKTYDDFEEEANTKQPKESNNKNKMSKFKNSNYSQVKRRTNNWLAGSNKRENAKPTWHDKGINESNPQIKRFKPPTKRSKEDAINIMKKKFKGYVKSNKLNGKKEKKKFKMARNIFITALERNHSLAPEDMRRLLKPWIGAQGRSGVYILGDDNDNPKVGDAGDLDDRVIGKGQQGTPFIFMFTDELIESGFISQDDVDTLYDLELFMFQGHHPDKEDYSKDKICRQLAEAIIFSIYEMRNNRIAEFVMQIPSDKVRWVSDSEPAFESIADLDEEDQVKLLKYTKNKSEVFFFKTWITIGSELEKDDKVEYFLKPKPPEGDKFLKRHMALLTIDDNLDAGFVDALTTSPFHTACEPVIAELSTLLEREVDELDPNAILETLDELPEDDYMHPPDKHKYNVRKDSSTKGWFEQNFPDKNKITIPGSSKRVASSDDAMIKMVESSGLIVHKTLSGHTVIVRGSYFIALAVTASYQHRFNALRGLVDEATLMYSCGFLSAKGLRRVEEKVLSTMLLLVGIQNSITNPSGSDQLARNYIIEDGMSFGGDVPGADALRKATDNKAIYYALVLLLSKIGRNKFNKMLLALGPRSSRSIRIDITSDNKYLLHETNDEGDTGYNYSQYDRHKKEEFILASMEVLDSLDNIELSQVISQLLVKLFVGSKHTNNNNESRRNRLKELVLHVHASVTDTTKKSKILNLLIDLPDFEKIGSSPEDWMERFNLLKEYKLNNSLSSITKNVPYDRSSRVLRDFHLRETGQLPRETTRTDLPKYHDAATGTARHLLERELNVVFDMEVVEEANRETKKNQVQELAAAHAAKIAQRKEERRKKRLSKSG